MTKVLWDYTLSLEVPWPPILYGLVFEFHHFSNKGFYHHPKGAWPPYSLNGGNDFQGCTVIPSHSWWSNLAMFHNLAARSSPPWPSPHFGLCHAFAKPEGLHTNWSGSIHRDLRVLIEGIMVGPWPLNHEFCYLFFFEVDMILIWYHGSSICSRGGDGRGQGRGDWWGIASSWEAPVLLPPYMAVHGGSHRRESERIVVVVVAFTVRRVAQPREKLQQKVDSR